MPNPTPEAIIAREQAKGKSMSDEATRQANELREQYPNGIPDDWVRGSFAHTPEAERDYKADLDRVAQAVYPDKPAGFTYSVDFMIEEIGRLRRYTIALEAQVNDLLGSVVRQAEAEIAAQPFRPSCQCQITSGYRTLTNGDRICNDCGKWTGGIE